MMWLFLLLQSVECAVTYGNIFSDNFASSQLMVLPPARYGNVASEGVDLTFLNSRQIFIRGKFIKSCTCWTNVILGSYQWCAKG